MKNSNTIAVTTATAVKVCTFLKTNFPEVPKRASFQISNTAMENGKPFMLTKKNFHACDGNYPNAIVTDGKILVDVLDLKGELIGSFDAEVETKRKAKAVKVFALTDKQEAVAKAMLTTSVSMDDVSALTEATGFTAASVKGVIYSLVKKELATLSATNKAKLAKDVATFVKTL